MNFKNLVVMIAAIFLVAACESTSVETGKASGGGDVTKSSKKKSKKILRQKIFCSRTKLSNIKNKKVIKKVTFI